MRIEPDFPAFRDGYDRGQPQVLWTTLIADVETPVSAMLKLGDGRCNAFLFESVEKGVRGRYSVIGMKPDLIWRCHGRRSEINRRARFDPTEFSACAVGAAAGPLASLRAVVAESRIALPASLPPIAAGLFGYLGYDVVRLMEHLPDARHPGIGVADGILIRPSIVAVFDNVEDTIRLCTPVWPEAGLSARRAYDDGAIRIADTVGDLERTIPYRRVVSSVQRPAAAPASNMTRADYDAMIARAKAYIAAGDIFQVVPSQRFSVPFSLPPFALYRSLRRLNPSPFMFYLSFDGFAVVGSSPEIMVRVRGDTVTIRPIAGTRPRGATAAADRAFGEELLADAKERAEHLMLLDLGRNDVGRVADVGSVTVTERFAVERYSHVMHIVSNVDGRLSAGRDCVDALIAGFPAGTVSGAPKVRAMEIIEELEPTRRGIYAGCIGYFSAGGDMDTCIALRTGVVKDGTLYVQAGGGIVADSDADAEFAETCNKARAVLRAAEEAARYAAGES
ncbi:MAG: anthranilate synthase component I [Rhodospirillales bacterium]|jgi:anthranilate synthase component 1|nr:anthranilate synthase component I [Rhodospirillales bacterium]